MHIKGFEPRRMQTLAGWVNWRRRVGHCPGKCQGVQETALDRVLGKTQWREVKVEVLARLGQHLSCADQAVSRLHQRRLVALLGDIDQLAARPQLEAIS